MILVIPGLFTSTGKTFKEAASRPGIINALVDISALAFILDPRPDVPSIPYCGME